MQLLKFLFSIILVQGLTATLVLLSVNDLEGMGLVRLLIPLFFIALLVALWFNSLSGHYHKDKLEQVKSGFAEEREELRVKAERAKTRIVKQAQKDIAKEAKTTHAKANFKVGAAFAGVLGVGVLFVFAQMITAGLLTLSALGGAVGGYYWRGKRMKEKELLENKPVPSKIIDAPLKKLVNKKPISQKS